MLLLLLPPALARHVFFRGNWPASTYKDEAVCFFEYLEPDRLPSVHALLSSVENSPGPILASLSPVIAQPLLGLLNLSLALRFFHPRSSARKSAPGFPYLRGWGLSLPSGSLSAQEIRVVHRTLVSYAAGLPTPRERLAALRAAAVDLPSAIGSFGQAQMHPGIVDALNRIPSGRRLSLAAGRRTDGCAMSVMDALIEEYRLRRHYNFTAQALDGEAWRPVYHWTAAPAGAPKLEGHDWATQYGSWPDSPPVANVDAWAYLRVKKPLVTITIFFTLKSPESPALLEWAEEMTFQNHPFHFYLVLVADMENETERHIAYSWIKSVDYLGCRNACLFMVDGFKNGFKRAYSATLPEVSWRNLVKELPNSTLAERFEQLQN
jgi:hypothetical protein